MRNYLLLTLFLYSCSLFSQDINYINVYHKPILQAEEYILSSKFDSALVYYKKAFEQVPYVFCYDYVNAAYIAHRAGNNKLARVYLDSAVVRGAAIRLNRMKIYFDDKQDWINFKKHKYYQLRKKGEARWDKKLISVVDSLYKEDQKYRSLATKSMKNVSYDDVVRKNDSLVAIHIKRLLQSGQLTEDAVGSQCFGKVGTIILHFLLENKSFIYECYKKGLLEKRDYYDAATRMSLDANEKHRYMPLTDNKTLVEKSDYQRNIDGIIALSKLKYLKKFENKSKGLFFTLYY